jgi:hypothetical protein
VRRPLLGDGAKLWLCFMVIGFSDTVINWLVRS